jgi:hypothetical protein
MATPSFDPCPFCGAGETWCEVVTDFDGRGHVRTLRAIVKHWCRLESAAVPAAYIEVRGQTPEDAVRGWNKRSDL